MNDALDLSPSTAETGHSSAYQGSQGLGSEGTGLEVEGHLHWQLPTSLGEILDSNKATKKQTKHKACVLLQTKLLQTMTQMLALIYGERTHIHMHAHTFTG